MTEPYPHSGEDVRHEEVRYELKDVGIKALLWGLLIIFVFVVLGLFVPLWLMGVFEERQAEVYPTPLPLIELRPTPPLPRLQPNPFDLNTPEEDLAELNKAQDRFLNSYEWVERDANIVRIPIDQAMEIYVELLDTDQPSQ